MKFSVDFDQTLSLTVFDEDSDTEPFIEVGANTILLDCMKEAMESGHEVHIVTSRHRKFEDHPDRISVEKFCEDNDFHPTGIHFTDGRLKALTLDNLGIHCHTDDCDEELDACNRLGIATLKVDFDND